MYVMLIRQCLHLGMEQASLPLGCVLAQLCCNYCVCVCVQYVCMFVCACMCACVQYMCVCVCVCVHVFLCTVCVWGVSGGVNTAG